jgi:hypothetical protein
MCGPLALTWVLLAVTGLLAPSAAYSQPDWLKDVLQLSNTVRTSPEVSAIVLHTTKEVEIDRRQRSRSVVRFAVKVLSPAGRPFGELRELVDPYRDIEDLKGWTVLPDGSVLKMDEDRIARAAATAGSREYSDDQILLAWLPEIQAGAVVAFEYKITEKGWPSLFQSFTFQLEQPVLFAGFSLKLPEGWTYHKLEHRMTGIKHDQSDGWHHWTARGLSFRPEEPLAPSWNHLARRIIVSAFDPASRTDAGFAEWSDVASWYAGLAREAAVPDEDVRETTLRIIDTIEDPAARLAAVVSFVGDLRYVGVEFGEGKWKPRCAGVTLRNRYGDCKDKSIVTQAMLSVARIASAPVLASLTQEIDQGFPNPLQFNHVIVGVPTAAFVHTGIFRDAVTEDWLFLDVSSPEVGLGRWS